MEKEDFEWWSCDELFYHLLDNLVIPPDSELKHFRAYKPWMVMMAEEFEEKHNNYTELA